MTCEVFQFSLTCILYWGKTLYQCNVYLGETIYDISTAAIEKLSPRYAGNVLLLVCTALGMFALPVSGLVDLVVVMVNMRIVLTYWFIGVVVVVDMLVRIVLIYCG